MRVDSRDDGLEERNHFKRSKALSLSWDAFNAYSNNFPIKILLRNIDDVYWSGSSATRTAWTCYSRCAVGYEGVELMTGRRESIAKWCGVPGHGIVSEIDCFCENCNWQFGTITDQMLSVHSLVNFKRTHITKPSLTQTMQFHKSLKWSFSFKLILIAKQRCKPKCIISTWGDALSAKRKQSALLHQLTASRPPIP